jgi:ssDNA thymidine ADP-ribosyltransferase DarT-like protein
MIDTKRRDAIQSYCAARKIGTLVHFTRIENLPGIFAKGLLPRSVLESQSGRAIFNDSNRIDGHKEAVCLSISFPNYKMFYPYRQADQAATWAVLLVRADILWELECAFCWANAACSAINRESVAVLRQPSSLERMFADQCGVSGINRAECQVSEYFPTNPQAEVLAFSCIPLSFVTAVYFEDQSGMAKIASPGLAGALTIGVKPEYFSPRCDWRKWQKAKELSPGESWQNAPSSIQF